MTYDFFPRRLIIYYQPIPINQPIHKIPYYVHDFKQIELRTPMEIRTAYQCLGVVNPVDSIFYKNYS